MSASTAVKKHEIAIIGGGPAGLAAAISAYESGCRDVLLIERDRMLGGILNQCIHDGFGLHRFKEALSGPEYAARYIERLEELDIKVMPDTIVLNMNSERRLLLSTAGKLEEIEAEAVILAMGCRERARGALSIPGNRPAGVYTAGAAQNFVNMENIMPGKNIVILGSGDIGLIMARRMTLEGAKVEAVFEVLPYSSGLPRNIQQCLVDYDIPLYLSTTVIDIVGADRLEGVTVAQVDDARNPVAGTERFVPCDTLLLSVGLIPENELARDAGIKLHPPTGGAIVDDSYMTSVTGIFSCGNALHVHDLVDWVSEEAARAGAHAAAHVRGKRVREETAAVSIAAGQGVRYVMPQQSSPGHDLLLAFRVSSPSKNGTVEVWDRHRCLLKETHARLHPAEMVWLKLDNVDIREGDTVEVRVGS